MSAEARRRGSAGISLTGELQLVNDYVYRGVSYTDGNRGVRGLFNFQVDAGARLGFSLIASSISHAQSEFRYVTNFSWRVGPGVRLLGVAQTYEYLGLTCTKLVQPSIPGPSMPGAPPATPCTVGQSANYDEYGIGLGLDIFNFKVEAMSYDAKGVDGESRYDEVIVRFPALGTWAVLGNHADGYSFLQFGVSRRFGRRYALSLSYLAPIEDPDASDVLSGLAALDLDGADEEWLVKISFRF